MARTLGWFYLAGATLGALSLLLPRSPATNVPGLAVNIAIAFAGAAILLSGVTRLPEAAIPLFLAFGSLLISSAVYLDGHSSSVYSFFYVWVGVEAFYFLSRRLAA